jgi:hypothetical protein
MKTIRLLLDDDPARYGLMCDLLSVAFAFAAIGAIKTLGLAANAAF